MKKIMYINVTCGIGSTGNLSLELYNGAKGYGYESIFCYSCNEPKISDAFKIETKFQNITRRGFNKYFGRKQKHSTYGTKRLIKFIEKENPDIIHLHNIHLNILSYPLFFEYIKKKNIPIVFTLHDCWSFTGGCYYFTKLNCREYKNDCRNCKLTEKQDDYILTSYEAYEIKKSLIGGNNKIYIRCVSEWLSSCAKESYMRNMDVSTIYNGIDTNIFHPKNSDLKTKLGLDGIRIILGVANIWENRKGLDIFIKLSEIISDEYSIVLVGLTTNQINDLPINIKGLNPVNHIDELVELYSFADVYFNASKEETFGLTTIEALSCGTPAIVYNSTALPETITEDVGIVLKSDNIGELAEAIEYLCDKGKDYYEDKCVAYCKEKFDVNIMVDSYFKLYESILNEKI